MSDTEVVQRNFKNFTDRLWTLKTEKKFCDSAIIANDKRIDVHALVLACSSETFESLFIKADSTLKDIQLDKVDSKALDQVIEYCYKGKLDLSEEDALAVYNVANLLEIPDVAQFASGLITNNLSSTNTLSAWKHANKFKSEDLKKAAFAVFKKNFDKITESNEFKELKFEDIYNLLDFEPTEDILSTQMFKAINDWINHDKSLRSILTPMLMKSTEPSSTVYV